MAASDFTFTHEGFLDLFKEDFETDDHYAILLLETATPNAATWVDLDDVVAHECADDDYARQDCSGESLTQLDGEVTVDVGDISFGEDVSITAKYVVLLRGNVAGADGADRIVGWSDLNEGGGSVSSSNGAFGANIHSDGLLTVNQV